MRGQSAVKIIAVLVLIAVFATVAWSGIDLYSLKIPSAKEAIRLGLDLAGGSRIVYSADTTREVTKSEMETATQIIRRRLDSMNYFDAEVTTDVENKRLIVFLPSVTDPEQAVRELGQTAMLTFRDPDGNIILDGSDIATAEYAYGPIDESGVKRHYIALTMTEEGSKKFAEATEKLVDEPIGIYLDENLQVNPIVNEPITDGRAIISGNYTRETASATAALIRSGSLPFSLKPIQLESIGPSLGQSALNVCLFAGTIAIVLVMLFMVLIYRLPGLVADIALSAFIVLNILVYALFRITLTLPGIAGFVLSVGMAVDANIVIFERIKEELAAGKTLRASISAGFHRAFSAIVDSNVTTVLAGIVLWKLGSGPIQGFAYTLIIGVIISMFTAIFLTRFLLNQVSEINIGRNTWLYGVKVKEATK